MSRFDYQYWPSRSCNLTQLDFFLWGFFNSTIYANKPTTTHDLKENWAPSQRNWAILVQNGHRKFLHKNAYVPAKSIGFSIHNPLQYTLWVNKKSQFFIQNLYFSSKLLLAWFLLQPSFLYIYIYMYDQIGFRRR